MKQERPVPKRRFNKFINEWKQSKLKGYVELENGYAFKSVYFQPNITKEIVLTPGNVNIGGGFQIGKGHYYDYDAAEDYPQQTIMEPGDIFVTMTDLTPTAQALGFPAIVPDDGNVYLHNQRLGKLVNYDLDKDFLFNLLCTKRYHKQIVMTASGTTVKHSSSQRILNSIVFIPSREEQQKIGQFFKHLDEMIALEQRKIDKTKALKSAYLAEMFPAEGERVPKRRFAGFTEDWKEIKLEDIADIVSGGTPSTSSSKYWNGDIDWYTPAEIGKQIYANKSIRTITKLGLEKSSAKILPTDRTILFTSRAGIGDMAILKQPGATNQGFQSIVLQEDIDTYFIYSMGYLIKQYALKNASGSTFLEISGKPLGNMQLLLPSSKEQIKIGEFFQKLDNTITNQQQKLDKLKATKQAYLHEMFV